MPPTHTTYSQIVIYSKLLILILCSAFMLTWSILLLTNGQNGDEDFYLASIELFFQGNSIYSDYSFPGMPLIPVFYGLLGSSLSGMRTIGFVYLLLTLVTLNFILVSRFAASNNKLLLFNTAILSNGTFIYFSIMTPKYILTILFFSISFCIFTSKKKLTPSLTFIMSVLLLLTPGIRLTTIIAALVFLIVIVLNKDSRKHLIAIFAGLVTALLFYSFCIGDIKSFIYQAIYIHTLRNPPEGYLSSHLFLLKEIFLDYPFLFLLFPLAVYASLKRLNDTKQHQIKILFLIIACLFIPQFLIKSTHSQYFSNTIPFLYVALIAMIPDNLISKKYLILPWLIILFSSFNNTPTERLQYNQKYISQISQIIQDHTEPEDKVLSLRNRFTVEANRDIYPGTELGQVSFADPGFQSQYINLLNEQKLLELVSNRAVELIFWSDTYTFDRYFPSLSSVPLEKRSSYYKLISNHYHSIYKDDNFEIFTLQQHDQVTKMENVTPTSILKWFP